MQRCIHLARAGLGTVAPNPMVGCVIVHDEKIIGEGCHQKFGFAHAEVNAIASVKDVRLLEHSTLYVNLEPCVHYGKTPPCTSLILKNKIPRVVTGCADPFEKVSGKGIAALRNQGIEVVTNVLEKESLHLNKRFITYHKKKRPYIILKWAQSADGFIAYNRSDTNEEIKWISNKLSRTLVHKWRSEEQAVMAGTNTAMRDNPQLTVRLWQGKNPLRIVLDKNLKLHSGLNLFNGDAATVVFTAHEKLSSANLQFIKINFEEPLKEILRHLYLMEIQSVIIEGGSTLLNSFIAENLWDEARIFTSDKRIAGSVPAPPIHGQVETRNNLKNDILEILQNQNSA